jgi:hypothetical protein
MKKPKPPKILDAMVAVVLAYSQRQSQRENDNERGDVWRRLSLRGPLDQSRIEIFLPLCR